MLWSIPAVTENFGVLFSVSLKNHLPEGADQIGVISSISVGREITNSQINTYMLVNPEASRGKVVISWS